MTNQRLRPKGPVLRLKDGTEIQPHQNPQYQRSARIHADILKGVYSPKNTTFEADAGLVIEAQPKQVEAKPLVIDVNAKDLSK